MIRFFTVFLIFFTFDSLAQDALVYYRAINKGRVAAVSEDYRVALKHYKAAFQGPITPFARDAYNALELSACAGDTAMFYFFAQKALTLGIRLRDLENLGLISEFLPKAISDALKMKEDSLVEIYERRIIPEIREEINAMFSADQEMRAKYYEATLLKRKKIGKEWEDLNTRQVERIIELTGLYGFPGEHLIGLDRTSMHEKVSTQNFSAGMPIVLLIHHYSQPNPSHDQLLLEELKRGNIHNEHFATICDFEAEFGKGNYPNEGYFGFKHVPKNKNDDLLDSRREKIGLLSVEMFEEIDKATCLTKFWKRLY